MHTSIKDSALRQTEQAINQYQEGRLDCAITLAAAGEGILPVTEDPHLRQALQPYHRELDLNLVVNWLKHGGAYEAAEISEFEAVIAIARAITKYVAVYHQSCSLFEGFLRSEHEAGHIPKLYRD